jgi:hypothetical protein
MKIIWLICKKRRDWGYGTGWGEVLQVCMAKVEATAGEEEGQHDRREQQVCIRDRASKQQKIL